ncbi:MAG: response regulator [Cyanobacteria bacterium NC_groundwater_1444_Ag_S-0.65um_54_12]|nr:response regulator [Cyanobacteria bacterium NC_groundwater_1444_Ag_S-0.65um_54_12]
MQVTPLVLVVEDEAPIRRFLRASLPLHDYRVVEAATGAEGLRLAAAQRPDVLILDLGLPDLDGIELVRELRVWSEVPIVILSARDQETEKVAALDAGADDYVTKPFGIAELLARLRVALRHGARRTTADSAEFEFGDWRVNLSARQVVVRGQEVHLTPTEFRLLTILVRHSGKVVTHRQLIKELWGESHEDAQHTLHVHMSQLRRKIETDATRPLYLRTEPGVGYRIQQERPV